MNIKLIKTIGKCAVALMLVGIIAVLACGCGKEKTAGYKQGDIVKIPIEITENPGMIIAKTVIKYDTSALEYLEYENGFFTDNTVVANNGTVTCLLMADFTSSSKDVTEKGTAATLIFRVKEGAKAGEYQFSIDEENSEYANIKEKFVSPKVSITKKITIK